MSSKIIIDKLEKERRKKACDCGYNPHDKNNNEQKNERICSIKDALKNHVSFPSMQTLSNVDNPSAFYVDSVKNLLLRHWAVLVDIHLDVPNEDRPIVYGFNQFGEQVVVGFYPFDLDEPPKTFSWKDLKPGHTLVILYASKKVYHDGRQGIRQESTDTCIIFKAPLSKVQEEAQKLINNVDKSAIEESLKCSNCQIEKEDLQQCSKCKLTKYCTKDCQLKHWNDCHKKLCSKTDELLRLAALPRHIRRLQNWVTFDRDQTNYLPIYE